MSLEQDLEQIGLEEKEAKVYLAALELGATTIQNLSIKAEIKRSTVYEMLKSLKNMGLISQSTEGKKKLIVAKNPDKLKRDIKAKEQLINEILPELKSLNNNTPFKPKITFYENKNGIREIYLDTLSAHNKTTLWISPIQSMLETIGEDFLNKYVEERTKQGIWVKSVYITSQQVPDYKYLKPETFKKTLREIRFTPHDISIANTMCIYDNKVAIISSRKEGFGFVIESEDYAQMMKIYHKLLWDISKPLENQEPQIATEEDIYH